MTAGLEGVQKHEFSVFPNGSVRWEFEDYDGLGVYVAPDCPAHIARAMVYYSINGVADLALLRGGGHADVYAYDEKLIVRRERSFWAPGTSLADSVANAALSEGLRRTADT